MASFLLPLHSFGKLPFSLMAITVMLRPRNTGGATREAVALSPHTGPRGSRGGPRMGRIPASPRSAARRGALCMVPSVLRKKSQFSEREREPFDFVANL